MDYLLTSVSNAQVKAVEILKRLTKKFYKAIERKRKKKTIELFTLIKGIEPITF